jgi:hypothetical protein
MTKLAACLRRRDADRLAQLVKTLIKAERNNAYKPAPRICGASNKLAVAQHPAEQRKQRGRQKSD